MGRTGGSKAGAPQLGLERGTQGPALPRPAALEAREPERQPCWALPGRGCSRAGVGEPWGSCMSGERRVREGVRRGFAAGDAS